MYISKSLIQKNVTDERKVKKLYGWTIVPPPMLAKMNDVPFIHIFLSEIPIYRCTHVRLNRVSDQVQCIFNRFTGNRKIMLSPRKLISHYISKCRKPRSNLFRWICIYGRFDSDSPVRSSLRT